MWFPGFTNYKTVALPDLHTGSVPLQFPLLIQVLVTSPSLGTKPLLHVTVQVSPVLGTPATLIKQPIVPLAGLVRFIHRAGKRIKHRKFKLTSDLIT